MMVNEVSYYKVNIPFKNRFVISHLERRFSESVFVKVVLDNGIFGWGESLPREYVTGETQDSAIATIKSRFRPMALKLDPQSYEELLDSLNKVNLKKEENAAFCAIELALLDSYGKHFKKSVSDIFGGTKKERVIYSGAVSAENGVSLLKKLSLMRLYRIQQVKVKVGTGDDENRIRLTRKILGLNVDIRLDANCAWSVDETLRNIDRFKRFGINAVEQPVNTINEIMELTKKTTMPIVADESLCTLEDAKKLKGVIYDIRISKCGGLLNSYKIFQFAKKNKAKYQLGCQLGCHVGESGILTAAGRHFATGISDIEYLEGSYGRFILKEDITREKQSFSRGGYASPIPGYGLGVDVKEKIIEKHMVKQ